MYANVVVDVHEEFDIVDFAETFFETGSRLLIVKEKARKAHWHVHGTWKGDRKAYKEYHHSLRAGEGRAMTRPVRVSFDRDEKGFQYCCKESPPNVIRQWHISDADIEKWHQASEDVKKCSLFALKRSLSEVSTGCSAPEYFRNLKRAAYDHQIAADKTIHPSQLNSYVVTTMYATDVDNYKEWILVHK